MPDSPASIFGLFATGQSVKETEPGRDWILLAVGSHILLLLYYRCLPIRVEECRAEAFLQANS